MTEQFARSGGRAKPSPLAAARHLTFEVSPEMVEQWGKDWSQAVRFKFEKHDDGTVTMWLQSIEAPK